jgi:hypothetical protein
MNITPFWLGETSTEAKLCVKDVLHIWDEQSAKDWSAAVENRSEVIAPAQLEQLAAAAKTHRDFLGAFNMEFAIPSLDMYAEYKSPLITEAELLQAETPLITEAELLQAETPLITEAELLQAENNETPKNEAEWQYILTSGGLVSAGPKRKQRTPRQYVSESALLFHGRRPKTSRLQAENKETPLITEAVLTLSPCSLSENKETPLITEALSPCSLWLTCNEEM